MASKTITKPKGGLVSRAVYDRQMSNLDKLGKQLELTLNRFKV